MTVHVTLCVRQSTCWTVSIDSYNHLRSICTKKINKLLTYFTYLLTILINLCRWETLHRQSTQQWERTSISCSHSYVMELRVGVNEVGELVAAFSGKLQPSHEVVVSSRHVAITTTSTSHHRPVVTWSTYRWVTTLMTMSRCRQPPAVDLPSGLSTSVLLEWSLQQCATYSIRTARTYLLYRKHDTKYELDQLTTCSSTWICGCWESNSLYHSKRLTDRAQNYGGVAIVYRSSFKSSKLSSLPPVKTFQYVCCRCTKQPAGLL